MQIWLTRLKGRRSKMAKNVLILNGSPRKNISTSGSFAEAFSKHFINQGGHVRVQNIRTPIETDEEKEKLNQVLEVSDCIGIFFPLYVDSLPSQLMSALYHIEDYLNIRPDKKGMKVFAVTQCGYPFTENMQHAINNCMLFTEAIGGVWLGSLSYGGGVMINGASLDKLGKTGEKLNRVFHGIAHAVIADKPIPDEVLKPVYQKVRPLLFLLMTPLFNAYLRRQEKKLGIKYLARPYAGMHFDWD